MNIDTICTNCMESDTGAPTCPVCAAPFNPETTNELVLQPRSVLREQYVIGRVLGQGGFGVTYLAYDINLANRVAIKEYAPAGIAGRTTLKTMTPQSDATKADFDWGLERFIEEARTLRTFSNHPNIVSIQTVFRENTTAYLVMEYLEGRSLEEFLRTRGGTVPFDEALDLMLPVMDALNTVHAAGILHRDVSPRNILISQQGKVKLIDFGAARAELSQQSRKLSRYVTVGYTPEEQHRSNGAQGRWTDVYALGATFYRTIVGKAPPESLDRLVDDKMAPPSRAGVRIPSYAEAALLKALAVRGEDRFQTVEDFKKTITEARVPPPPPPPKPREPEPPINTLPPPVPPPPVKAPSRFDRRIWIPAGILAAILLFAIGARLFHRLPKLTPDPDPNVALQTDGQRAQALEGAGHGKIAEQPPAPNAAPVVAGVPVEPAPVQPVPAPRRVIPAPPVQTDVRPVVPVPAPAPAPPTPAPVVQTTKVNYAGLVSQAITSRKAGNFTAALDLLARAIQADPNRPDAYNERAVIELYDLNDADKAIPDFQRAINLGGEATLRVHHDDSSGWLHVKTGTASFTAETGSHNQDFPTSTVSAKNKKLTAEHAFHIEVGSKSYTFSPTSKSAKRESEFIVNTIGR